MQQPKGGLRLTNLNEHKCGGINSSTYSFWQNVQTTLTSNAFSTTNIQSDMNNIYIQLVRGTDAPDLIVSGATDSDMANLGFTSVKYLNSDVVYDSSADNTRMYFLNTNYLRLETAAGRNFVPGEKRDSVNQDALVVPMFWSGNLTCSNRSLQGILHT